MEMLSQNADCADQNSRQEKDEKEPRPRFGTGTAKEQPTTTLSPPAKTMASRVASSTAPPHPPHLLALTSQIHHNLLHQHDWASLTTHTHSPTPPHNLLPRPLLSGLPPHRIYTHPDTQLHQLMSPPSATSSPDGGTDHTENNDAHQPQPTTPDLPPQPEWVLPTHIDEKWSLSRLHQVFSGLPPADDGPKRVLLATAGTDSTVVYYILHEGIVKPRQN
ncbi:hypothetical protein FGG08_007139 [Glutinoglossum americanum]|uniref:tRNA-splicing endonuclease subunit Sen15 domain-containing protein n=1 Tax=Glutinoglossum americanum TaxID=1670608 RepID=A0A9P8HZY3_9PEZI|nr:hypothetical protein FGG08_007139 [Glutinoglossum americanum]